MTRGSEQELVLPNLSPADATTYSCTVTVSSANQENLIGAISNQSSFDLIARGKLYVLIDINVVYVVFLCTVQNPAIHFSPGGRGVYYSGEDLNVTCISSVVGAVFTWRAVNFIPHQPLILPNTTISIGSNTSVLILRPIRVSDSVLVDFICAITFPENMNIIGSTSFALADINSELTIPLLINF